MLRTLSVIALALTLTACGGPPRPATFTTGAEIHYDDRLLGVWELEPGAGDAVEGAAAGLRFRVERAADAGPRGMVVVRDDPSRPAPERERPPAAEGYIVTIDVDHLRSQMATADHESMLGLAAAWTVRLEPILLDGRLVASAALGERVLDDAAWNLLYGPYAQPSWQAWLIEMDGADALTIARTGGFGASSPLGPPDSWRRSAEDMGAAEMRQSLAQAMRSGDEVFGPALTLRRVGAVD